MSKALDLSSDNVSIRWKYVKRNLLDMGIGVKLDKFEEEAHRVIKNMIQRGIDEEFNSAIKAKRYERSEFRGRFS